MSRKPKQSDPSFTNIYADGFREEYFSDVPFYCDYLRSVLALFERPATSVIDIGCGNGLYGDHLLREWQGEVKTYIGYDIDEKIVSASNNPSLHVASLQDIPTRKKFDLVLCHSVLQYVDDLDCAFKKLRQLVKKKGVVSIFQTLTKEDYDLYQTVSTWQDPYAWQRPKKEYYQAAKAHFDFLSYGLLTPKGSFAKDPYRIDRLFLFGDQDIKRLD